MVDSILFKGQQIEVDKNGYLLSVNDWSPELALVLAESESIVMTEAHWEVVNFVRDFYLEYKTSPAIRALVKAMGQKFGDRKSVV